MLQLPPLPQTVEDIRRIVNDARTKAAPPPVGAGETVGLSAGCCARRLDAAHSACFGLAHTTICQSPMPAPHCACGMLNPAA